MPSTYQRHKKMIRPRVTPLIYVGVTGVPSGLRPALSGEGRRENVHTESKTCWLVAEMALSAVRKNPQKTAGARANSGSRQKKTNRLGLAFKVLVVQCGLRFELALTTGEQGLGCLSLHCRVCPFRIVKTSPSPRLYRLADGGSNPETAHLNLSAATHP